MASFSYEMSTLPAPSRKALVASRPLPGSATTFSKNEVRYLFASSSVPPLAITWW